MTAFEDQHGVWTYDESDAWLRRNAGCADRLLVTGVSLESATRGANGLAEMFPGHTFEVRDIHNTMVHHAGPDREPTVQPVNRRRRLGTRGM